MNDQSFPDRNFPEYQPRAPSPISPNIRAARIDQVLDSIEDGEHAGKPGLIIGWRGTPSGDGEVRLFSLRIPVTHEYVKQYQPKPGGYWVATPDINGRFNEDCFQGFLSAEAFEREGYTRV